MLESLAMSELIPVDPAPVDETREEYEAPELRDLGTLVDVTETGPPAGTDGPYS